MTPLLNPLIILFLLGKLYEKGDVPGINSDSNKPSSSILLYRFLFIYGYTTSIPHPKTPIVFPPLASIDLCATESIPSATPLITP